MQHQSAHCPNLSIFRDNKCTSFQIDCSLKILIEAGGLRILCCAPMRWQYQTCLSTECSRRISRWGSLVTSVTISISQFAIDLVTSVLGLLVPWYAWVGRSIATMAWQWHGPRMVESSQRWKLSWFPIHIFPIEGQLDGMYFEPSSITMAVMEYYNTWMGITWNNYDSQTLNQTSHTRLRWHLSRCLANWLQHSQFGPYEQGQFPGSEILLFPPSWNRGSAP